MALGLTQPHRNEYQEYFRGGGGNGAGGVGLTTLPPSCVKCLEIWRSQPLGTLRACPGLKWGLLYHLLYIKFVEFKFTNPTCLNRIQQSNAILI
jgi:hypothetical protein